MPISPISGVAAQHGHADSGFSVLEAMVAMAVLAGALLPLLALQGQFVRSVAQMDNTEQRLAVQSILSSTINSTNLMTVQEGAFNVSGVQVVWKATPLVQNRAVKGYGGMRSRFNTAYYNVEATVTSPSGRVRQIEGRGIGWKETRSMLEDF